MPPAVADIPHSLDRFQIDRILGKGGMGTVYLARDEKLQRPVALKVLHSESLTHDDAKARFMREARAAAAIRHPNVATIYEVSETLDGLPFIVMEFCEGETLSQKVKRHPLDAAEFLNIARQLASGLAAAHENGIVHRDLKSANIIIEPSGLAKILDFGLAKLLQREELTPGREKPTMETTSSHFFGTLHYLSPEQARGVTADERSDLFSLGVVFYQMASGHLPFDAEAPLMVLERIRDSEPAPFVPADSAFPPAAARVIGKLLQKSPVDRYATAREVLQDLDAIETPTSRISVHHTRSTIGRTLPRRRWNRFALAAVAIAALIGGAFLVSRRDSPAASPVAPVTAPIRSMAVLPFHNIATNTNDEFLSVGLADALVTKLQQIPSLQVRPTSAVLEYRGKQIDARKASEELQVDGILEGNFLSAGRMVRVNLQLTDARTGYGIWATAIDGERENLLKLIDDVSSRTVTALNQELGVREIAPQYSEARSTNPKAYEAYMRARALTGSLIPADYQAQIKALQEAIELDPNFAAAYAELAIALSLGQTRGLLNDADAIERAEWYARQAVRLDANLPQAHLALGRVFVRDPERYRESVRENLAAIRLNANDTHALNQMATYFVSSGDLGKAQCVMERLIRLDPSSTDAKTRGYWYINSVDPEGALQNAQYALASKDTELAGHDIRALAYILQGNLNEAEREAGRVSELVPTHYLGKSLKAMIAAARGDRPAAERLLNSFEADAARNHWAAIRQAHGYARLGDREKALQWVERAAALGHHSWHSMVKHPWLQSLQSEPRFASVIAKMKANLDDVRDDVIGVHQLICR